MSSATTLRADELIPGNAAEVSSYAGRLRHLASDGLRPLADSLEQSHAAASDWRGDGGVAARARIDSARSFFSGQAGTLDALADAFDLYAEAIRLAQTRAAEAIQLQAYAEAVSPYPAAWWAHARAELILRHARWSLGSSAEQLADVVDAASASLPPQGDEESFWKWLADVAPDALKIAGDLALIVAGALLMAIGTGLDLTGIGAFAGVPAQAGGAALAVAGVTAITGAVVGTVGAAELSRDATVMYSRRHGRESQPTETPSQHGEFKKPVSGSGKEKATDIPTWVQHHPEGKPYVTENGKAFATRMLNSRYGEGNWTMKEYGRLFSQLRKYGDRAFQ